MAPSFLNVPVSRERGAVGKLGRLRKGAELDLEMIGKYCCGDTREGRYSGQIETDSDCASRGGDSCSDTIVIGKSISSTRNILPIRFLIRLSLISISARFHQLSANRFNAASSTRIRQFTFAILYTLVANFARNKKIRFDRI